VVLSHPQTKKGQVQRLTGWSDSEVVERWFRLFPPRGSDRKPMKVSKEPLARLANKQDKCTGAFFEGRFKSIAILDEESLVSVCAYIDLNPVAGSISCGDP
jgi:hypothetical protein